MHPLDICVLVAYFLVLSAIGWHSRSREHTAEAMLIGNRQIPWWAVLLSVLGTEISALTFVGVPAFAYSDDIRPAAKTHKPLGQRSPARRRIGRTNQNPANSSSADRKSVV